MAEKQFVDKDCYSIALGAGPMAGVYFISRSGYKYSYRPKGSPAFGLYCTHNKCMGVIALNTIESPSQGIQPNGDDKRLHSHRPNKFAANQCRLRAAIAHYLLPVDHVQLLDEKFLSNLRENLTRSFPDIIFNYHAEALVGAFIDELLSENMAKSIRHRSLWEAALNKIARMSMALVNYANQDKDFRICVNEINNILDLMPNQTARCKQIDKCSLTYGVGFFIDVSQGKHRKRSASPLMTSTPFRVSRSSMDFEMLSNSHVLSTSVSHSDDTDATLPAFLETNDCKIGNENGSKSHDSQSHSDDTDATVPVYVLKSKSQKRAKVNCREKLERVENWREMNSSRSRPETQETEKSGDL